MPHLRIEASAALAHGIAWAPLAAAIHGDLAAHGWAALADLKSRVVACDYDLAADDAQAQQLVATLVTTHPRPPEVLDKMKACILAHLERAVADLQPRSWVQCCVIVQAMPPGAYAKVQWHPPHRPGGEEENRD